MSDADPSIRYIAVRIAEEGLADAGVDEGPARGVCAPPTEGARKALATLGDVRLIERACELTAVTEDAAVAVAAGLYLARVGHPDGLALVLDVVAGARKTPEHEDEAECIHRAGELGLREAIPHLEGRAWSAQGWVRSWLSGGGAARTAFSWSALAALALLGDARARGEILAGVRATNKVKAEAALIAAERARLGERRTD